jgi:hypothetical protein
MNDYRISLNFAYPRILHIIHLAENRYVDNNAMRRCATEPRIITLCLSTNEVIRTPSSQQQVMDASKVLTTLMIH